MTLYLDTVLTFGKYKGKRLFNVPKNYVQWLHKNTEHKVVNKVEHKVKGEEKELTFIDYVYMENLYRRTCAKIGRRLLYSSSWIPF